MRLKRFAVRGCDPERIIESSHARRCSSASLYVKDSPLRLPLVDDDSPLPGFDVAAHLSQRLYSPDGKPQTYAGRSGERTQKASEFFLRKILRLAHDMGAGEGRGKKPAAYHKRRGRPLFAPRIGDPPGRGG